MAFGKLLQQSESHFSFLLAWTRINRGKNKRRKGYFYCRYDSQRGLQCYAADSMKGKVFDMFGRIYERRHSPMWRWNCCGKIIRQKCTEGFRLPAGSGQYIYTKTKMTSCQRLFFAMAGSLFLFMQVLPQREAGPGCSVPFLESLPAQPLSLPCF